MDIKKEVVNAIEQSVKISKTDFLLDDKLQEIGISSMDFFKMIIVLTKKMGVNLRELDPALVTTNMTVKDLIRYLINRKH